MNGGNLPPFGKDKYVSVKNIGSLSRKFKIFSFGKSI